MSDVKISTEDKPIPVERDNDAMLKGVEAATYCVALVGASLALYHFFMNNADTKSESIFAWISWFILSIPILTFAQRAFAAALTFSWNVQLKADMREGKIAFIGMTYTCIILAQIFGIMQ